MARLPGDEALAALADEYRYAPYRFIVAYPRQAHRDHLLATWRAARDDPDHALFWHEGALVHAHISAFDTAALGAPAANIATLAVPSGDLAVGARLAEQAVSWADSRGVRFLQARCDARDLAAIRGLECAGMRYADAILRSVYSAVEDFERYRDVHVHEAASTVRPARADDVERLVSIGRKIFRKSRFHRDPDTPPGMAGRLHESWVRAAATGERGLCLVSEVDGRLAGFFTSSFDESIAPHVEMPLVRLELSAVLPMPRAPTIWMDLMSATVNRYNEDGLCLYESRPQVYNVAIVQRENKQPPSWQRAEVALHRWQNG